MGCSAVGGDEAWGPPGGSQDRPSGRLAPVLRWALVLAAGWYIAVYAYVAVIRVRYPFELEWMEGACVDHVRWILAGKLLYGPPSFDFVPFIYTPLHFYLSAAVSKVTGVGFLPLRLVSLVSSLGCLWVIWRLVARETKSGHAGFVAAGLFAATYRLSGCWFDIARVDSLLLLLLLAVVYVVRLYPRPGMLALSGLLTWVAFLAKQSGPFLLAPVVVGSVVNYGRRSLLLIGTAIASFLVGNWMLDRAFNGWFSYYVLDLPRAKGVVKSQAVGFWMGELLPWLAIAMVVSAVYLGYELRRGDRARGRFYALVVLGLVGGSWVFRMRAGVYYNALMPAHATIAILCGLGLGRVARGKWLRVGVYAACLVQLAVLVYAPSRVLPTDRDLEAGRRMVATLAAVRGEVYIPEHGYLAALAGKRTHAHGLAMRDVKRGDPGPNWQRLDGEVRTAIEEGQFEVWVLETLSSGSFLTGKYVRSGRLFDEKDVFWPVTGMRTRPDWIYRREEEDGPRH